MREANGNEPPSGREAAARQTPGGVSAEARTDVREERLQREHEAQRRVAKLVAGGAQSAEVFQAIAEEVGDVIDVPLVVVWRYEPDGTGTVIGVWSEIPHPFTRGSHWSLDGGAICAMLRTTGRPGRVDDLTDVHGTIADAQREAGMTSCAGAPIMVGGEIWGAISALATDRAPMAEHLEDRLAAFTELVAAAISNSASREEIARLADQEAALRRVATLVARGVAPPEVFAAVAREVGLLLAVDATHMTRYERDGTATVVAGWSLGGGHLPVGKPVGLDGDSVAATVRRTGRPARIDSYEGATGSLAARVRELGLGSSVGAPIVVDQQLWGVIIVSCTADQTLAPDTESRVSAFTELVGMAISNTESRVEAARLADEQAALRRVATLVARGVPQGELFDVVVEKVGRLFGADRAGLIRYDGDAVVTPVASWPAPAPSLPDRWATSEGDPARLVAGTRRAVRIDDWSGVPGPIGAFVRDLGVRSSAVSPILVEGRVWGALAVHTRRLDPFPADTESRLENFSELLATAVSNIQARVDLAASRARVVATADEERRRVVRDLHDGAQQRLIQTIFTLRLGQQALESGDRVDVRAVLAQALDHAQRATEELRELAHGILPATLTHGGLRAGVHELVSRTPLPVEERVCVERFPAAVEATAYFVVAEALTNIAKHAQARHASVTARVEDDTLQVRVCDDGIGGAQRDGSGLLGLADRMAALDGQLRIESPPGGGTLVGADFPLHGSDGQ
ncbi:MAG TPA: GAF domain-containing sensor histidine kinase [Thermoleophilaceae bacterium]|nr:GAF domain-containing sensor histidine kinase [Thermoleophilaceae bacterium]